MNARFATRRYSGSPRDFYLVTELALTAAPTPSKRLGQLIISEDCSGSMYSDHQRVISDIEKVLTRAEFDDQDMLTSYVTWASNGDCVVHWKHVSVREVNAPGSPYLNILRGVRTRGCTGMSQGLYKAKELVLPNMLNGIWLLSDGYANDRSPTSEAREIDKFIDECSKLDNVFVNTVAFNAWSDFKMLSRIANALSGQCIQAQNIRQVYDSLVSTAQLLAGATVPAIASPIGDADYQVFLSRAGQKVNGTSGDLLVRGLKDGDDKVVYRFQKVTEAVYNASTLPVCGEGATITPVYAFARAQLAEGNLQTAKYALVSTRNATLLERHATAVTGEQIAALATDLDAVIYNGVPNTHTASTTYGLDTGLAPVLSVLGVMKEYASDISVDLKALSAVYTRRGVKRITGVREQDGTVTPCWLKTEYVDPDGYAKLGSVDINKNNATANILVTRAVRLVKADDGTPINKVAGIDVSRLTNFNNYTIVGDGSLNVPYIKVHITSKKAFKALKDIGVVSGDFDSNSDYTISFEGRPLTAFEQQFANLDGVYRKVLGAKVLVSLLTALLKEASDEYTPDQIAELERHYLSKKLYLNFPTTTEYADLQTALTEGTVDTRLSYKVEIGDTGILNMGKLHSANKFLDRMFTVTGGADPKKPTCLDFWGKGVTFGYKTLSSRTVVTEVDNFMKPIFEDFLGLASNGRVEEILREAGVDDATITAFKAASSRTVTGDDAVETFTGVLRTLENYMDRAYREVFGPVVFYIGATGLLPEEFETKALTAEQFVALYPDAKLSSDEKEGTFFVVGNVVITVYVKSEYYSTGRKVDAAQAA